MDNIKCNNDNGEWAKHYCTNDCNTCGYNKLKLKQEVYLRGLTGITKTHVFEIKGEEYILNDGSITTNKDIGVRIFLNKELAQKSLKDVYFGKIIE